MKNFKKIGALLFLSAYLIIGLSFTGPVLAADPVNFTPQISIPGSNFQQGTGVAVGKVVGATTTSDLLANYIAAFYNWGLSIVGVLAVLMLMAGGITWLTSGGDSGKIGSAKKMIEGSLLGTFLLLGAYFFLNTINPNLTKLPVIEMAVINRDDIKNDCVDKNDGDGCVLNKTDKIKTGYCVSKSCIPCRAIGLSCVKDYECKSANNGSCGYGDIAGIKYPSSCKNNFCSGAPAALGSACGDNNIGICSDNVICPDSKSVVTGGTQCATGRCCADQAKDGEACGANSAGQCLPDLTPPTNFSRLTGGRDCGSGLFCYQPAGKVGESCGLNHPGICRSGTLCPSGENGVSGGRDCVSGANCCEGAGSLNQECGDLAGVYGGTCLAGSLCPGLWPNRIIWGRSCKTGLICCGN